MKTVLETASASGIGPSACCWYSGTHSENSVSMYSPCKGTVESTFDNTCLPPALHWLLWRWCWQMLVPLHSLHRLLRPGPCFFVLCDQHPGPGQARLHHGHWNEKKKGKNNGRQDG